MHQPKALHQRWSNAEKHCSEADIDWWTACGKLEVRESWWKQRMIFLWDAAAKGLLGVDSRLTPPYQPRCCGTAYVLNNLCISSYSFWVAQILAWGHKQLFWLTPNLNLPLFTVLFCSSHGTFIGILAQWGKYDFRLRPTVFSALWTLSDHWNAKQCESGASAAKQSPSVLNCSVVSGLAKCTLPRTWEVRYATAVIVHLATPNLFTVLRTVKE